MGGRGVAFTGNWLKICVITANDYLFAVTVNLNEKQRNVPCVSW